MRMSFGGGAAGGDGGVGGVEGGGGEHVERRGEHAERAQALPGVLQLGVGHPPERDARAAGPAGEARLEVVETARRVAVSVDVPLTADAERIVPPPSKPMRKRRVDEPIGGRRVADRVAPGCEASEWPMENGKLLLVVRDGARAGLAKDDNMNDPNASWRSDGHQRRLVGHKVQSSEHPELRWSLSMPIQRGIG